MATSIRTGRGKVAVSCFKTRFSHLIAYTSTCAQYPNEYAHLAKYKPCCSTVAVKFFIHFSYSLCFFLFSLLVILLRCCFLAILSCFPLLVLVLVMFCLSSFFSSGDSTATVTALQSGRSPHGSASSILRTISSPSWAPRRIDTTSSAKIMLMTDLAGSVLRSVPAMDLRGWVRASSGKH